MTSDPVKVEEPELGIEVVKTDHEQELDKVKGQLKALEIELDGYKESSSAEVKEKADLIAAEKKARSQVCGQLMWVCLMAHMDSRLRNSKRGLKTIVEITRSGKNIFVRKLLARQNHSLKTIVTCKKT